MAAIRVNIHNVATQCGNEWSAKKISSGDYQIAELFEGKHPVCWILSWHDFN